jgi:FtsP/CotA-like multicopper oxidase with cupredoxin domain
VPGQTTATYGFNGDYLGPTLRATDGDPVRIQVTNHLGETTTVHWHGMHLPAAMDGGPHQTIDDNSTWSPEFTIRQPAATLWYHPHMLGETLRQVGMGLAGLFILDDANGANVDLPRDYGVDDIPLILQATGFGADGQFRLNGGGGGGRGGGQTTTLVNGAISPAVNTPSSRLRLRLLNASSQQFYNLGFAGGETFHQVASDGGLLTSPVQLTRLQLAPGERAEIVVDVNPGGAMALQGFGGNGGRGGVNFATGSVLTINPAESVPAPAALPAQLAVIDRLSPASAAQSRDFVLGGNDNNPTINGQAMTSMAAMMDMANTLQVKLGDVEIWNLINRSNDTLAFHVHDVQYQILDRDGGAPAANEAGLKDTVVVRPGEAVRIIMRFTDYADPMTAYMYHCHLLNHEDNGMMGQFVVV